MYIIQRKISCILLVLTSVLTVSGCGATGSSLNGQSVLPQDAGNRTNEAAATIDPVPAEDLVLAAQPVQGEEPMGTVAPGQAIEQAESVEVKYQMDVETMAELEDLLFDGIGLASELEETFSCDRSEWFASYNGEKLQRIPGETESLGPAAREDIIFYRAEEGEEPEDAVIKMFDAMMVPLMEPSDGRAYVILEYGFTEGQPMLKVGEGIWMLRYIDGFYRYEGTDLVTMEQYMESEPGQKLQNGMMPFQRQGSDRVFLYLLLQEGDVYRLQRYESMINSDK